MLIGQVARGLGVAGLTYVVVSRSLLDVPSRVRSGIGTLVFLGLATDLVDRGLLLKIGAKKGTYYILK